jgi:hypothetical protein
MFRPRGIASMDAFAMFCRIFQVNKLAKRIGGWQLAGVLCKP